MKAVVSRHRNTLHLLTLMLIQYVVSASACLRNTYRKALIVSLLRTFSFADFYGNLAYRLTDWLANDWLTKDEKLTAERRMTSGISRFLYKFQLSKEKRRFLLVRMLNFVISNWSKITILNTLNPLVSIYVTLLPLLQPVWTPTRVTLGCFNGQAWLIWNPFSKI